MQDHRYSFEIDAAPEELWRLFWGRKKGDITEHGDVRIEILHAGDATGEGLIRHCHFRVPRYLFSGGKAMSWEWLTEVNPCESWRYDAVGKPLWSKASGWTRFERLDDGRTRVHFRKSAPGFPIALPGKKNAAGCVHRTPVQFRESAPGCDARRRCTGAGRGFGLW